LSSQRDIEKETIYSEAVDTCQEGKYFFISVCKKMPDQSLVFLRKINQNRIRAKEDSSPVPLTKQQHSAIFHPFIRRVFSLRILQPRRFRPMPVNIVFPFLKQQRSNANTNTNALPSWHVHVHDGLLRNRILFLLRQIGRPESAVSVVFLDDPAMAAYNLHYRSKSGPTNVLSFPAAESRDKTDPFLPDDIPNELAGDELGDILISVETAEREAREKGVSLHQRLTELLIHGLLHLIGYDHEISDEQAEIMFLREKELYRSIQQHHAGRKKMPQLAINVDHIATIRQARGGAEPDPVHGRRYL
jgi:rRNA maturation RNase YbeY